MTTLISWKANDNHGISSVYLASDSRFSWGSRINWDYGQKIFGSKKYPEIIGYCGDVLFAINVISTLIYLIDNQIIYGNDITSDEKNSIIFEFIKEKFHLFPKSMDTTIVHVIKDNKKNFAYYEIKYFSNGNSWNNNKIKLNDTTEIIGVYGSGRNYYEQRIDYYRIEKNELIGTSRFFFMVLCEVLSEGLDKYSGGAPQISGLYRGKNNSIDFGTVWNNKRYLYGLEINNDLNISHMEWRNEKFERYDPKLLKMIEGAQQQPWPNGMKKPPWW